MKVYKYAVPVNDTWHPIEIHIGAKILHVAVSNDPRWVNFWALIDPEQPFGCRRFRVYGTGHVIDAPTARHVGTTLWQNGQLVWHLFELKGKDILRSAAGNS